MSHGLLPKMPTQGSTENVNWSKFWKGLLSNLNNTKKVNNFTKNFILQQENLNRHSVNLSFINKKKVLKLNDS